MASTGREQIGIGNGAGDGVGGGGGEAGEAGGEKKSVLTPVFKSLLAGSPLQYMFLVILPRLS